MTNKIRGREVDRDGPSRMFTNYLYVACSVLAILNHIRRPSGPTMPGPLHNTFWKKYDK